MQRRDGRRVSDAAWAAWRQAREEAERRERRTRMWLGAGGAAVALAAVTTLGIAVLGSPAGLVGAAGAVREPAAAPPPVQAPAADTAPAKPVVWVQAGHAAPREPGYETATGATGGPYETEAGFTVPVARRIVRQLRAWGVDARYTPGMVTPLAATGDAFVSIHHDAEGGQPAVVWAIQPEEPPERKPGRRRPTVVDQTVEVHSRHLAQSIHDRYATVFRAANGAETRLPPAMGEDARADLSRYYGFYRTQADARVIVEAGAAGDDDDLLERTGLVSGAIAAGIRDHLVDEGLLPRRS